MYCNQCGAEIEPGMGFCPHCGAGLSDGSAPATGPAQATYSAYVNTNANAGVPYPHAKDEGLLLAAFVLNVISTVCLAFTIIGLAWAIPMTVRSYGIYKGTKPNTVAFGVCTLIFLNLIAGILQLVAEKDY